MRDTRLDDDNDLVIMMIMMITMIVLMTMRMIVGNIFTTSAVFNFQLAVPASCSDDDLLKVASFRSRSRIPVSRQFHANSKVICGEYPLITPQTMSRCLSTVQPEARAYLVSTVEKKLVMGLGPGQPAWWMRVLSSRLHLLPKSCISLCFVFTY